MSEKILKKKISKATPRDAFSCANTWKRILTSGLVMHLQDGTKCDVFLQCKAYKFWWWDSMVQLSLWHPILLYVQCCCLSGSELSILFLTKSLLRYLIRISFILLWKTGDEFWWTSVNIYQMSVSHHLFLNIGIGFYKWNRNIEIELQWSMYDVSQSV